MSEPTSVILPDSPEAATLQTVTGWVSAKGHFYGIDEKLARYDGSTHRLCSECGNLIEKNGYCAPCHVKKKLLQYEKMPRKKWNGQDMLYSLTEDRYFYSNEDLEGYVDGAPDVMPSLESLCLIICEPIYASEIDINNIYEDSFPDDDGYEVPQELVAAFENLNSFLLEANIILSWSPGRFAADIEGGAA